jgi:hypothetical protein
MKLLLPIAMLAAIANGLIAAAVRESLHES